MMFLAKLMKLEERLNHNVSPLGTLLYYIDVLMNVKEMIIKFYTLN